MFSFQQPSWANSGWVTQKTSSYLNDNNWRPVVVQELRPSMVDVQKVYDYVQNSVSEDEDYGSSGVCSQQVSMAINAATSTTFNPPGFDTPYSVYKAINDGSLASQMYFDNLTVDSDLYAAVARVCPTNGVRNW